MIANKSRCCCRRKSGAFSAGGHGFCTHNDHRSATHGLGASMTNFLFWTVKVTYGPLTTFLFLVKCQKMVLTNGRWKDWTSKLLYNFLHENQVTLILYYFLSKRYFLLKLFCTILWRCPITLSLSSSVRRCNRRSVGAIPKGLKLSHEVIHLTRKDTKYYYLI